MLANFLKRAQQIFFLLFLKNHKNAQGLYKYLSHLFFPRQQITMIGLLIVGVGLDCCLCGIFMFSQCLHLRNSGIWLVEWLFVFIC